jgi:hypothetical protein
MDQKINAKPSIEALKAERDAILAELFGAEQQVLPVFAVRA